MKKTLSVSETAARLGVKRDTVYAYVSRGLLRKRLASDGRTSQFEAAEVDALRAGRRRTTEGELDTLISTALTEATDGSLRIRGKDVMAMVANGEPYEAAVDWLWAGPGEPWELLGSVAAQVTAVQQAMPANSPLIDRLRVTTAVVSATDALRFDASPRGIRGAGRGLLLAMVAGLPPVGAPPEEGPLANRLWPKACPHPRNRGRASGAQCGAGFIG